MKFGYEILENMLFSRDFGFFLDLRLEFLEETHPKSVIDGT